MATDLLQVAVLFKQNAAETPVEQGTFKSVLAVEVLGVDTVQLPHATREIGCWHTDHQMIVVRHHRVSVEHPTEAFDYHRNNVEEDLSVFLVYVGFLPSIALAGDQIICARVLDSDRS